MSPPPPGGGSYVSFPMCFHGSKYSGGIQEARASSLWVVAHLSSWTTWHRNFLTWQWLCQKPLITSLDLSGHSIKQYSHYASRRAEPNTWLLLEFSTYSEGEGAREKSEGSPHLGLSSWRLRVAGYTGLSSVTPGLGNQEVDTGSQAPWLQKSKFFSI